MAALPPNNGPLQVAFSFDTTGSMSRALTEVRGRLADMLQRLQTDIPAVSTAVVAHGDYCDDNNPYLTQHLDFTTNLPQLLHFVHNVKETHGGDEPEAYEVMLRLVRRQLTWTAGSQRVLVVIGDAFPHQASDSQNVEHIDWRQETLWLQEMGVRIYGVQVDNSQKSTEFFKTMTDVTGGQHLTLSEFGSLCDVIMAICYREKGAEFLQNYEAEVRAREGRKALHKDLEGVFGVLRRADSSASSTGPAPAAAAAALTKAPSLKTPPLTKTTSISKTSKTAALTTAAKKLVARAARATGATPRARRFPGKRTAPQRRLQREKVPESNFRFRGLSWSAWKLVAVPADVDMKTGQWRRILKGSARGRGGAVFGEQGPAGARGSSSSSSSVVCEAAVQTRPGARRHVVWSRVLPASSANRLSFSRLLVSPRVRAQLQRVTSKGCRVWVRWSRVKQGRTLQGLKQQMKEVYDYAWCHSTAGCREVWVPNGLPAAHRVQIAGPV